MIHIRKHLSKAEREEYQLWLERHQREIRPRTRGEVRQAEKEYWEKHAAQRARQLSMHPDNRSIPSVTSLAEAKVIQIQTPMSEEEYQNREAAAQEEIKAKQQRVAPVYNKGGYQYYSDGMVDSMLDGKHRRR